MRQLWTFTGEHPPLRPYLKWIKGMMSGEGGDDVEPPVVWTLHDIDFAVAPYEQVRVIGSRRLANPAPAPAPAY